METFHLSSAYIALVKRTLLLVALPLCVLAIVIGVGASQVNASSSGFNAAFISVPLMLIVLAFTFIRLWRQQRKTAMSYRLSFLNDVMTREQIGYPTLRIARSGVTRILENTGGALIVYASDPNIQIIIPALLENYAEVRARMATWHAIELANATKLKLGVVAGIVGGLAFIALWLAVMIIPNKISTIGLGVACWAVWFAFQVYVQRNPLVDRPLKRNLLFTIIPMFVIAIRMLAAITVQ